MLQSVRRWIQQVLLDISSLLMIAFILQRGIRHPQYPLKGYRECGVYDAATFALCYDLASCLLLTQELLLQSFHPSGHPRWMSDIAT